MADLKPCPFCGGEAHIGHEQGAYWVQCEHACGVSSFASNETSAAKHWNTRALPEEIEQLRAELADQRHKYQSLETAAQMLREQIEHYKTQWRPIVPPLPDDPK